MERRDFLIASASALATLPAIARARVPDIATPDVAPAGTWRLLSTEAYKGKQDDVFFVDADTGWYGNGVGRVFKTVDGGATWTKQFDQPGTFVRAIGFVDARLGFFGNIGPGYFPNVSDTQPLYRTRDGGATWAPVTIDGPPVDGICAIDILHASYINAGQLEKRTTIRAGGRVGGPALLATSRDGGETFTAEDLSANTAMILDVKFVNERIGFIAGATSTDVEQSRALVLATRDGGRTWARVYEGTRPYELTWKLAFPSPRVGYVTVQSYDPDTAVSKRVVAKTVDAGATWRELPLIDDHAFRAFGIGFVDERRGWVGGTTTGLETIDGGSDWRPVEIGKAVNKVRVVRHGAGTSVIAIGTQLHRLDLAR